MSLDASDYFDNLNLNNGKAIALLPSKSTTKILRGGASSSPSIDNISDEAIFHERRGEESSSGKRKSKDSADGDQNNSSGSKRDKNGAKKRFVWPDSLHREFISAVFDVGLNYASCDILHDLLPEQILGIPNYQSQVDMHIAKVRMFRALHHSTGATEPDMFNQLILNLSEQAVESNPRSDAMTSISNGPSFLLSTAAATEGFHLDTRSPAICPGAASTSVSVSVSASANASISARSSSEEFYQQPQLQPQSHQQLLLLDEVQRKLRDRSAANTLRDELATVRVVIAEQTQQLTIMYTTLQSQVVHYNQLANNLGQLDPASHPEFPLMTMPTLHSSSTSSSFGAYDRARDSTGHESYEDNHGISFSHSANGDALHSNGETYGVSAGSSFIINGNSSNPVPVHDVKSELQAMNSEMRLSMHMHQLLLQRKEGQLSLHAGHSGTPSSSAGSGDSVRHSRSHLKGASRAAILQNPASGNRKPPPSPTAGGGANFAGFSKSSRKKLLSPAHLIMAPLIVNDTMHSRGDINSIRSPSHDSASNYTHFAQHKSGSVSSLARQNHWNSQCNQYVGPYSTPSGNDSVDTQNVHADRHPGNTRFPFHTASEQVDQEDMFNQSSTALSDHHHGVHGVHLVGVGDYDLDAELFSFLLDDPIANHTNSPIDLPTGNPKDHPVGQASDHSSSKPKDNSEGQLIDYPVSISTYNSVLNRIDDPKDIQMNNFVGHLIDYPVVNTTDNPDGHVIDNPAGNPRDQPIGHPVDSTMSPMREHLEAGSRIERNPAALLQAFE